MVDHQTEFAKVMYSMCLTIAVILLGVSLEANGYRFEHPGLILFDSGQVFFFEPSGKAVQPFPADFQDHFALSG